MSGGYSFEHIEGSIYRHTLRDGSEETVKAWLENIEAARERHPGERICLLYDLRAINFPPVSLTREAMHQLDSSRDPGDSIAILVSNKFIGETVKTLSNIIPGNPFDFFFTDDEGEALAWLHEQHARDD